MHPNNLEEEYSDLLQRAALNKERERERRIFDAKAIERILGKIASEHWRPSLDCKALAQELEQACKIFKIWEAGDRGKPTNKQIKDDLEGFQNAITRLRKKISPPSDVRAGTLALALCNTESRINAWHAIITNMATLEDAANEALARLNGGSSLPPISGQERLFAQEFVVDDDPIAAAVRAGYPLDMAETSSQHNLALPAVREIIFDEKAKGDPNNARSWLIGRQLPAIFGRYFKGKPHGVSRSLGGKKPGGPAIRFVLEVLSIAQIPSSNGTPYMAAGIEEIFRAERSLT